MRRKEVKRGREEEKIGGEQANDTKEEYGIGKYRNGKREVEEREKERGHGRKREMKQ